MAASPVDAREPSVTSTGDTGFDALQKLPCVAADYNSQNKCYPRTRQVIIEDVVKWAVDSRQNAPKIFWLHGRAGEGKSCISASVASRLETEGLLGASFFFSRDTYNRNRPDRVFSSIASHLSFHHSLIRKAISDVIETNPDVGYLPFAEQFESLLRRPLLRCSRNLDLKTPIVIVIDALDECEEDRQTLLAILVSTQWPSPFKLFLSGQTVKDIQAVFDSMESSVSQRSINMTISGNMIKNDIQAFIFERFQQIRSGRNGLENWPTNNAVSMLVDQAHGLFIWASTVMRFIEDDDVHDPKTRLNQLLKDMSGSSTPNSPPSTLDRLYCSVLNRALAPRALFPRVAPFKKVVGAILAVADPLPPSTHGTLLCGRTSIDASVAVRDAVSKLRSVIDIHDWNQDSTQPIRIIHRSFADFLTDEHRSQLFYIDLLTSHTEMTTNCLTILASREMVSQPAFVYASLNLRYHLCYVLQAQKRRKGSLVRKCLSNLKNSLRPVSQNLPSVSSTQAAGLFDPLEARNYWKPAISALEQFPNDAGDLTLLIQSIRDQIAFGWAYQIYPPTDPPTSCRIQQQDTIILILGSAGNDKSSFVNLATEGLVNSSSSVSGAHRYNAIFRDPGNGGRARLTPDITAYRCRRPYNTLRNVVLVDTPGFDSRRPDGEILEIIGRWLAAIQREKIGRISFLFLHRIADTSVSTAPLRIMTMIERLYCKHLENVTIATTRWNEVDDETGSANERDWSHRAITRGARLARFKHTFDSAWDIINGF